MSDASDESMASALPVLGIAETIRVKSEASDGWASRLDAVVLAADFQGREDLIDKAMTNGETLYSDATLSLKDIGDGMTGFAYQLPLDAETDSVIVAGIADEEAVSWFQSVQVLFLTTVDGLDTGMPRLYLMAPNDPARWRRHCPDVMPFAL